MAARRRDPSRARTDKHQNERDILAATRITHWLNDLVERRAMSDCEIERPTDGGLQLAPGRSPSFLSQLQHLAREVLGARLGHSGGEHLPLVADALLADGADLGALELARPGSSTR